jgi:hypothetical protein
MHNHKLRIRSLILASLAALQPPSRIVRIVMIPTKMMKNSQ